MIVVVTKDDDVVEKDENGDDGDVTAPQILLKSFSLCNNCVMGGAVSAPSHFQPIMIWVKIVLRIGRRQRETLAKRVYTVAGIEISQALNQEIITRKVSHRIDEGWSEFAGTRLFVRI